MVAAYNHAQERGWNPVTTGRAPWLPKVYEDAVAYAGSVYAEQSAEARRRADSRVKRG